MVSDRGQSKRNKGGRAAESLAATQMHSDSRGHEEQGRLDGTGKTERASRIWTIRCRRAGRGAKDQRRSRRDGYAAAVKRSSYIDRRFSTRKSHALRRLTRPSRPRLSSRCRVSGVSVAGSSGSRGAGSGQRRPRGNPDLLNCGRRRSTVRTVAVSVIFGMALTYAAASTGNVPDSVIAGGYRLYPAPAVLARQCSTGPSTRAVHHALPNIDAACPRRNCAEHLCAVGELSAEHDRALASRWRELRGGRRRSRRLASERADLVLPLLPVRRKAERKLLNLSRVPYPQRLLGRYTIAGHFGKLYDQVSYSICASFSFTGHVTFVWSQRGVTYAASLHRWSARPTSPSVLAVLRALVTHLAPAH